MYLYMYILIYKFLLEHDYANKGDVQKKVGQGEYKYKREREREREKERGKERASLGRIWYGRL